MSTVVDLVLLLYSFNSGVSNRKCLLLYMIQSIVDRVYPIVKCLLW